MSDNCQYLKTVNLKIILKAHYWPQNGGASERGPIKKIKKIKDFCKKKRIKSIARRIYIYRDIIAVNQSS
jgi:hypothetical protein